MTINPRGLSSNENSELFKKCRSLADSLQLSDCSMGVAPVIEASTTAELEKERVYAPKIIHQYGKPSTYKANKLAYNLQERETLWNYTLDKIGMKDIL